MSFVLADLVVGGGEGDIAMPPLGLRISRCDGCERLEFPSIPTCPACGSETDLDTASTGVLGGFTSVLHAPPGVLVEIPYDIGVVLIRDKLCILGLLVTDSPLAIGDEVEVTPYRLGDGHLTFAFRASRQDVGP